MRRAIRAIYGLSQRTSCAPYFKDLNVLTLPCIFIYECSKFVKTNPDRFTLNSDTHKYPTRNANNIHIIPHRLAICDNSPSYIVPRIYNALPDSIKDIKSIPSFKKPLFNYLVKHAFYDVKQFLS